MPDPKVMQSYVNDVLKCLGEDGAGESLTPLERRIGSRYKEALDEAAGIRQRLHHLKDGIQKAQSQVTELSDKHADLISKASGFAESLIAMQFGAALEKEAKSGAAPVPDRARPTPAKKTRRKTRRKRK